MLSLNILNIYHQIPWVGGLLWELHWQWLWRLGNGGSHSSPHLVTILPSSQVCPVSHLHGRSKFFCFGNSKNSTRWSVRIRTPPGEADWKRWSGGNRGSWNRSTKLLTWKVNTLDIRWLSMVVIISIGQYLSNLQRARSQREGSRLGVPSHTFILPHYHTFILSYFHTLQIYSVRVLKEKGAAWVYLLYCDLPENDEKLESDTEFCFG